jgi:CheY-like chemotaxis protein
LNIVTNVPTAPILYVEDDANDVFFMEFTFARMGLPHPLQVVWDGQQGLDYLSGNGRYADRAKHPLPCLVLLDLNLPGCSGFDILQWLRQQPQFQALPVLVFTASAQQSDREKAREFGANEFITKPGNMTLLHAVLKGSLARWLLLL